MMWWKKNTKSSSNEQKHGQTKPLTINSMLVTTITPENVVTTHTINLKTTTLTFNKDGDTLTLHNLIPDAFPNICNINVAYCDDPKMMHASDWSDLGCTRILFSMEHAHKQMHSTDLIYVGKIKYKDFVIPERWPPNADFDAEIHI